MSEDSREQEGAGQPGSEGSAFVGGLFTGALIGMALAIVFAPQSGEETRDLLRVKSREASNRARDTASDLGERARSMASDLSSGASDVYTRGKRIVDDARGTLDSAVDEGKAVAESERNRLSSE